MALKSLDDIRQGTIFPPNSEAHRVGTIVANRRLLNNDFAGLEVGEVDTRTPAVTHNWFRRAATFFPEFMLAERPVITIRDNERFTQFIADISRNLWVELQEANIDMLAFGYGVVASHPLDPTYLTQWPPDDHYRIEDQFGMVQADVLVRRTGTIGDERIHVYIYPVAGEAEWRTYKSSGNSLNELVRTESLPARVGRQAVELPIMDKPRVSIFDDMKQPLAAIARNMTGLSRTLKRNSNPHLYGPDGAVRVNENGSVTLDTQGMYFPIQPDDNPPGYLQWDSKVEATRFDYDANLDAALNSAGMSKRLFSTIDNVGTLSGTALRRLLLPSVARMNHYKEVNAQAVESLIALLNRNAAAAGGEVFEYRNSDILIEWTYERVFDDTSDTRSQPPSNQG